LSVTYRPELEISDRFKFSEFLLKINPTIITIIYFINHNY
jgi:hypothetical protein